MNKYNIDRFANVFGSEPAEKQKAARDERVRKERRTQLTEKQRRRGAVRTTQLNFRCAPEFKQLVHDVSQFLDCSIADTMEAALALLVKSKGFKGGGHGN